MLEEIQKSSRDTLIVREEEEKEAPNPYNTKSTPWILHTLQWIPALLFSQQTDLQMIIAWRWSNWGHSILTYDMSREKMSKYFHEPHFTKGKMKKCTCKQVEFETKWTIIYLTGSTSKNTTRYRWKTSWYVRRTGNPTRYRFCCFHFKGTNFKRTSTDCEK